MQIISFLTVPILGGIIALSTNWLAIRMLFRPHREVRFFGIRLPFTPGLIPKERLRISKKLAGTISTKLLSPDVIARELNDPNLWPMPDITVGELLCNLEIKLLDANQIASLADRLIPVIATEVSSISKKHPQLDESLLNLTAKVIGENVSGFAKLFITPEKVYESIKTGISEHLSDPENACTIKEKLLAFFDSDIMNEMLAEKVLGVNIKDFFATLAVREKHFLERMLKILAEYFANHLPIENMIERKLAEFDVAEIEEIILTVAGRELRVIILLGGLLGFIIGLLVNVV